MMNVSIKVMPLGDSITLGWNSSDLRGYRSALWNLALQAGWSISFDGSLISGGRMVFRYGQTAQFIGYDTRSIRYVEDLAWNPPPWFPADSDWHVADWTEFDA